jgi:hypothetical protein
MVAWNFRVFSMANIYTHDELKGRVKSPGWTVKTGSGNQPASDTLEKALGIVHERKKVGQEPGLIEEIETGIELEMIQIEKLWQYLGLPV